MGTGFVHGNGSSAQAALAAVLANPAIWRGRDCAPEPAALATGFGALDAALPGRGWPRAALTEIVLEREGIGEVRLTLPALATLQRDAAQRKRDVVWIAPPYTPYAPALAAAGVDLARLFVVQCATPQEALWAYEQALRAAECGAAFAWLATDDARALRRLAVAAREGRTFGVLWRRPGVAARAATAALRLRLAPADGRLAVHVDKRRGGELAQPLVVDVDRAHAHRAGLAILPRTASRPAPADAPSLPFPTAPAQWAASA
ncbi:MAG: translesion DNA synthesis-associated protein ImuA [Proteobacteria bacterium]|nr:translesion DNA synthesis-associated protein ImuA [Pseudomonadota bacterium]